MPARNNWKSLVYAMLSLLGTLATAASKPVVYVETVQSQEIADLLTYPARILSKINATILSESDGVVTSIPKTLGTPVARGVEIMRVKHTDPVFQYAPVRVQAPVSGVISSVEVTVGSQVTKGEKLATITDPHRTYVAIEVAAPDLGKIKPNLPGELVLPGRREAIPVTVSGISPFVNPGTGTAAAELTLPEGARVPPGMVGTVRFRVGAHQGVQVPEDAVVYRGKDTFLRLVEDGRARLTAVELGPSRRGIVEILQGVTSGDVIVVRASQFIANGEEVIVEKTSSAN